MSEELYNHDEYEERSALSGELGKPSSTWMSWLTSTYTEGHTPVFDQSAGDSPPSSARDHSPGWDGVHDTTSGEADAVDGIFERPTAPLEPPDPSTAARRSGEVQSGYETLPLRGTLFEQRYGYVPPTAGAPDGASSSLSIFHSLPSYTGDTFACFHADLWQRRSEDERLTGRRWPGSGLPYPASSHEAMVFDQLAIALGEVDPRLLARESALRYVRASRLPGTDDLGPTDIYAIFYYGLGLSLRPLNCAGTPEVLATYYRLTREVYLDWTLLQDPPYGRAALDQTAWRRILDCSPVARILLAWSAATHLAENYDVPLLLGFSGYSAPVGGSGQISPMGAVPLSPAAGAGDILNRYRKTIIAFATLLAPQERLWQQISALRLGIHMGDPRWRDQVRALCSLDGSGGGWRQAAVSGHLTPGGFWYPSDMDPVEQLITVLSERNSCPPSIIEWQLDGNPGVLDWDTWSTQLLRDIPALQQRYALAEQFFYPSSRDTSGGWGMGGLTPDVQLPPLRLSF